MTKHADSVFSADPAPLSVALLLLNETSLLEVASTIDPLRAANRFAGRNLFSWTVATPDGEPAILTSGVSFPANVMLHDVPKADVLIVLAGFNHKVHAPPALTQYLRRIAHRYRAIGSIDSGGWVLARAGLLAGRRATVHWEDIDEFARTFGNIDVVPDRFVISGDRFTAGGAAPAMDLMLQLIRSRHGAALAGQVASAFIYDETKDGHIWQRPVSPGIAPVQDAVLDRAIALMAGRIEDPLSMRDVARVTGISRRLLETRFRARLGTSPGKYAAELRLQTAARLARDSALNFTEISLRCGYSAQAVFTRAFRSRFATTPGDYRRRHGTLRPAPQKTK